MDNPGGTACQCETQGAGAVEAWGGSGPPQGQMVSSDKLFGVYSHTALPSIQMKPQIQIIVYNLQLLNVSNKSLFLLNHLRTEQNTFVGAPDILCDSGLNPSSKDPRSSDEPINSSPSRTRCHPIK